MKLLKYIEFINEDVSKWKRSWVKSDSTRELGSEYQPNEMLEYVTSFHDQDNYDDTDFYERTHQFEKFVLREINIGDLDLDEFQLDDSKVDEYIEDYKNEGGEYPAIVVGEDLHGRSGKYGIIDGLHRANALWEMGKTKIKAYVGVGSPDYLNESYDTSFEYEDGYVTAKLNDNNGTLEILDWNSKNTEKGGTKKTLRKLRRQYPIIHAIDCGYEHEDSFKYWVHMLDKDLIDGFSDDHGAFYGVNDLGHLVNESVDISDEYKEELLKTHNGFNDREDAEEYLNTMLKYYETLGDSITLYRVLFIEDGDIDTENLGNHWTPVESLMVDRDWVKNIRKLNDISGESKMYIIEAEFKTSDINWEWTIHTNMNYPNEEEIMINDNIKPIEYKIYTSVEEFKNR